MTDVRLKTTDVPPDEFTPLAPELAGGRWIGVMNELRETCPVFHSDAHEDDGFYVLTKYEDLMYAHQHLDVYSNCPITIPPAGLTRPWGMIEADPPVHKQLRAVLNPYFAAREIAAQEDRYREQAIAMIEPLVAQGHAELAHDLCLPFPLQIITAAFNLPPDEQQRVVDLFYLFAHKPGAMEDPADAQRIVEQAAQELYGFFQQLIDRRREEPGDDLVSILCAAQIDGEPLTDYEVIDSSMIIVPAGFETTAYSLGYSFLYLAEHSDVRRELVADPSLIPGFVEELLRFETPVKALGRTVMIDHEVRGTELTRGDRVMMLWPAGNRDPEAFENPDEFDMRRSPNRHLGFGAGPHRCMGIHMARLSMRVLLEEWLARVPEFEVDVAEVKETPGTTWAVSHLPATWSTAS